jgi:hypothetical protein
LGIWDTASFELLKNTCHPTIKLFQDIKHQINKASHSQTTFIMGSCRTCLLITIRLFQLTLALAIIAFGAWSTSPLFINPASSNVPAIHIITSIREDEQDLFNKIREESDYDHLVDRIQDFFDSLLQTPKRVYFTIGAVCIALQDVLCDWC